MAKEQSSGRFLTPEQASRVYDRIGRFQDWQAVYEARAIRELIRMASLDESKGVFEFGCGTGAFAASLLKSCLPPDCRYIGIDIAPRMVRLATTRLQPWGERAKIKLSDGSSRLHEPDETFDHFVSNYVLDLLAPEYASAIIFEAFRVLRNRGRLCLITLGHGRSGVQRLVTELWERIWRLKPEIVGGCRPVDLRRLLAAQEWSIDGYKVVTAFGITSEVLVASRHRHLGRLQ
ncbi:MAG TPA: class I SAM-dependent methyltransferase [Candidatus Sulfotelmatobacter sp.]